MMICLTKKLSKIWILITSYDIAKLFRMEDTERLRSRMRERRRREVFEKAEKEEEREKAVFARFVFCFTSYHCLFLFLRNLKKKKSVFCEVFLLDLFLVVP